MCIGVELRKYKTIWSMKCDLQKSVWNIAFKSTCDILESELAENTNFEFDDVKLWYEPRGAIIDLSDSSVSTYDAHDGNKTIKCTPKWYFISDESSEAELHMINYITVDCVTGEIEVFFPGWNFLFPIICIKLNVNH